MKQKINNLNISEELKDSLEKLFLESDESDDINSASEIDHIYDSSESDKEMCPCKQGVSESDVEEDDYYKLISQFQDSDINIISMILLNQTKKYVLVNKESVNLMKKRMTIIN
ncbi:hypothetical protein M9H77_36177 [Catharanthus roseus]|uniref:Uncharacterized protein n=1 Tax=Catharanthus roseus TaxID=4058 RepID=A0ACB9ZT94_CATRO|nr:hypothetical protein M9H77_36177 [Catharanthus roseus]